MADLICVECHRKMQQATFLEQVFDPRMIIGGESLYCPICGAGPLCQKCYFENHEKQHR